NRAADELGVAAGLSVLIKEVDGVGATEAEVDRIDIIRQLWDDRGKILCAERHPQSLGDLAAERAIIQRKAEHLSIGERVVLSQRRDFVVVLDVVDIFAQPLMDLGAIEIEAEEIRRRIYVGRLERGGAAVDERNLRLVLRIVV